MKAFNANAVKFICRSKENKKFVELESFIKEDQEVDISESTLLNDSKVQLYTGIAVNNKQGNKYFRHRLVDSLFRLVIAESKLDRRNIGF